MPPKNKLVSRSYSDSRKIKKLFSKRTVFWHLNTARNATTDLLSAALFIHAFSACYSAFFSTVRIKVRYYRINSVLDSGCLSRIRISPSQIPDPNMFNPGSRIRIKEFKCFNPKNCFQAIGNMIRVVHPGSIFLTHPRSRIQGSKRHRIPDKLERSYISCYLRNMVLNVL